jgi:two-component system chemotaxis response regulator CheB
MNGVVHKIKVLIIAASVNMRKEISNLIAKDSIIEVIGESRHASEAVSRVQELRPDVVILDIEMPELRGLVTLTSIMAARPTPLLMLSSGTKDGIIATITGLQSGAVDFISKPSQSSVPDLSTIKDELVFKIKQAAQIPLRTLILNNIIVCNVKARQENRESSIIECKESFDQILAIGCGVGGLKALEIVISALPACFPYPLLVVQHIPSKYTKVLADRLNRFSSLRVVEAKDHQVVVGGTIYIAPGDYLMTVVQLEREFRIKLYKKPLVTGQFSSVDALFNSISGLKSLKQHFILMSGMGSDGAKGMLSAKQAGAKSTIVESQETSIVYEMPGAAVDLGCVDYEVSSHLLASKILEVTEVLKR